MTRRCPTSPLAAGGGYGRAVPAPAPDLPLVTDRLRLRLYRREDAVAQQRLYARPEVARYLLDDPWTPEDAETKVGQRLTRTGLDGPSRSLALVVEHAGQVIGDVALWLSDDRGATAEIGWVLDPEAGGRGFATEAVTAVLDHGFTRHRLHRVVAQMDARNTASARLAERLGMRREAHHRQNWWSKGEWTDTLVFALLAAEHRPAALSP